MRFQRIGSELQLLSKASPGLQLYSVRNELRQNILGTLKRIKEMGYEMVEFFNRVDMPADELKKALNDLGLKTVSTYIGREAVEKDLLNQIEYSTSLGSRYIIVGMPRERYADESEIRPLSLCCKGSAERPSAAACGCCTIPTHTNLK